MSIARHHAEWLSLLEISGPFLSMPVLMRVFPQGLDEDDPDQRRELRLAYEEWLDNQFGLQADPAIHNAWVRYVLEQTLQLPDEVLAEGQGIPPTLKATVAEQQETLRPDLAILDPDSNNPRLLVQIAPAAQSLEKPLAGRHWKASPAMRMMELLHSTGIRLGLVTNGEQWLLVNAPRGETTGFISWYAELWLEEKITLRALRSLLGVHRFFSVPDDETLETMLAQSQDEQHEVTDQLGYQVRRAVEVLVQAIDLADRDRGRKLLADVGEAELYEAALTIMMRLVFLFSAEERGLFPLDDDLYNQYYAASTLRAQLREAADQFGEEVIERRLDAWCRLLTTFRAIHSGIEHDRLRLPAYGGSLFDPDRFEFLEGRPKGSSWLTTPADPLPINNRTVLHLLEALQLLQVRVPGGGPAEARRLSFRALDIEQIGHVYESLLDHTAVRAETVVLGLDGKKHQEPEIPLETLESFLEASRQDAKAQGKEENDLKNLADSAPLRENQALLDFLKEQTGRSENVLKRALPGLDPARTPPPDLRRFTQLQAACGNDKALFQRVAPWIDLLRDDDLGQPVVILSGSVYVTAGTERRATGTHYTPKSLTEPIVQHTLEPLVYDGPAEGKAQEKWKLRSPARLLNLKICDMAMGSGAFLVQTCRYLSERLVEAWENIEAEAKAKAKGKENLSLSLSLTPEGQPTDNPDEAIPANTEERLIYARRLVADRCLYGVDKNPLAVEMAKLSLWLVTLDKNRPFTFLDHAFKCGDSLVGVNLDQLTTWSLAGEGERRFETMTIQAQIDEMVALRRKIAAQPVNSIADQSYKESLLQEAEQHTHNLRRAADLLVGSYLNDLNKETQEYLRVRLLTAARGETDVSEGDVAQADLGNLRPFHWPLEFPEVFLGDGRGGFDAFVGNPPFLGGTRISTEHGQKYLKMLQQSFSSFGDRADICVLFFRQGFLNLKLSGALGLIATNTISQGDTRVAGLEQIIQTNGTIFIAESSAPWPGIAAVSVSIVHLYKGRYSGPRMLDGEIVKIITPMLDDMPVFGNPYRLNANDGITFKGTDTAGTGFILEEKEAEQLIQNNIANREVIFPYLIGRDLNSNPDQTPSRMVINFYDRSLEEAENYSDCINVVRERVYPQRQNHGAKATRENWWRFHRIRAELYQSIGQLNQVLVCSLVTKYLALTFVPNGWVYSKQLCVFAIDDYGRFSILQSHIHEFWARKYSSTLETRLNYTPTDCFETFPFPNPDPQTPIPELETIGETYHKYRRQLMLDRQEGLTATYNRFHNPDEAAADIARLRALHVEMDQAVAAAYGWSDLDLHHDFHETPQGLRYTISESARREVLGRLLELNHARHEAEVKAGLHRKKGGKRKEKAKKGGKGAGLQGRLFD